MGGLGLLGSFKVISSATVVRAAATAYSPFIVTMPVI